MFERQRKTADRLYRQVQDNVPVEQRVYATREDGLRPQFFAPIHCRQVLVEDVWIQDILLEDIRIDPLRLDTWYRAWFGSDVGAAPTFRAISVRNMTAWGVQKAFHIRGLPERPIESLGLENISITEAAEPAEVANVHDLRMHALSVQVKEE